MVSEETVRLETRVVTESMEAALPRLAVEAYGPERAEQLAENVYELALRLVRSAGVPLDPGADPPDTSGIDSEARP
jgi:hypothetical protein